MIILHLEADEAEVLRTILCRVGGNANARNLADNVTRKLRLLGVHWDIDGLKWRFDDQDNASLTFVDIGA